MMGKICLTFCLFVAVESLTIVSRKGWGARTPAGSVSQLSINPPPFVVIHHSDTPTCSNKVDCSSRVKSIQNYHINNNGWSDIGYNFLVGSDGLVYEGRGWGKTGAHAPNYNSKSIGVCFLGTFNSVAPTIKAQQAVKELINYGVAKKLLRSSYKLVGYRQVTSTTCPGNSLYNLIKTWDHWTAKP